MGYRFIRVCIVMMFEARRKKKEEKIKEKKTKKKKWEKKKKATMRLDDIHRFHVHLSFLMV